MGTGDSTKRLAELSLAEREALFQKLKQQKKQQEGEHTTQPRQIIPRQSRAGAHFPASSAQQRLWFLDQYEPTSPLYVLSETFHIHGPLDRTLLQQSLDTIVARHETLRTSFSAVNGEPVQVISVVATAPIQFVDLSDLAQDERDTYVAQRLTLEARRSFDLGVAPLLRVMLHCLGGAEYVLQVCIHHIVSDGWSFGLFFQELGVVYTALAANEFPTLPELLIQYADYASWQQAQSAVLTTDLAYWQQRLSGTPALIALPTDHPRPALQTAQGARYAFALPQSLTAALKALSLREGTTLFMTVLAAYQVLLARLTNEDDIVVGTPIAGRTRTETSPLIGLFVNTLALRSDLSGDPTFLELLKRVREVCLDGYTHQEAPFEQVVERLMPERSLSYAPLFQVFFALQNTPTLPLHIPGLTISAVDFDRQTARFDLAYECWEEQQQLQGFFTYNTDLFEAASVARLAEHFEILLAGIVACPEQRLSRLPVLSEDERQQLLLAASHTTATSSGILPLEDCLHTLIVQQAEKTPQAIAVRFAGQRPDDLLTLTYSELVGQASQLAERLQQLGVASDTLVGVCLERSPDLIVTLLAILMAGGAYVPLDPDYPAERLAYMIENARLLLLITQSSLLERLPQSQQTQTVCLETLLAMPPDKVVKPVERVGSANMPSHLAYVLYTSGSTGRPKGVQIPQRALVSFLWSLQQVLALTPGDLMLAITSLSFDIAGLELWLPLLVGAEVQIVPKSVASDGAALRACLDQSGATLMQGTPASWRLMLAAGWQGSPHLRQILCGGEALPGDLAQQLLTCLVTTATNGREEVEAKAQQNRCQLWNLYGPTETTIWSTVWHVTNQDSAGWMPIGQPIANTQCYVLDTYGDLAPIGVAGELYIGGPGLARGYLGRADLTAERFAPDPFSATPGTRLYRTGDQARWQQSGELLYLSYLGRLDTQVKLRGYRIELGEIEAVLGQHPQVREAVAQVRQDMQGDQRLVAYIVPQANQTPETGNIEGKPLLNIDVIRQYVRSYLPEYMVPSILVTLEALPLTPNGKVDRKALSAPEVAQQVSEREAPLDDEAQPFTPLEEQIAAIWAGLLGVQRIRRTEQFFALGGHSLLATRLMAQVHDAIGVDLPVRILFEAPAFADFVQAVIRSQQNPQLGKISAAITRVSRRNAEELLRVLLEDGN